MSFAVDLPRFAQGQMLAGPDRPRRVFALTLAASVALHVVAILAGPSVRPADETPPRPLEVALVRPPVPEPMRPTARLQPRPPESVKPLARSQPEPTRRQSAPVPMIEQRQVLALPESAASPPSTFTVPQPSIEREAAAPEPKAAPPAPAAQPREVASTPAVYNAAYLRNAPPRYPLIARRNGVEGTVRLKVFVGKDGKPAQVQLDQSSGSAALDSAALDAVRGWQFVPARRGQEPIESWVVVPVVFRLEGTS
jgi:protein TonB